MSIITVHKTSLTAIDKTDELHQLQFRTLRYINQALLELIGID